MNVELRDEARDDLVEAAVFYGQQSDGLDEYFLGCLREDIAKLESTGGIHEQYHGFHRSLSERFPYAIYYLVNAAIIDVVGVLDCRRDPAAIASRLGRTKR
jgi:plasmid stabilization system protein ParE